MLYIVATPIGNLEDITLRALRVLKEADLILCEDTRHTKRLLSHYTIDTRTQSYHQHSDQSKIKKIIDMLEKGTNIALVSDAGTPGINDPGVRLVAEVVRVCRDRVPIVPIPGPSAAIAALSVSGLPSHEFVYMGFLPHKKGRQTMIEEIASMDRTAVLYESSHRVMKTLEALSQRVAADRHIVVCREMTKVFETIYRGTCHEVMEALRATSTKGEFVIIISPTS